MTVPITYTNIDPKGILSGGSRYTQQNVIYYGDQNFLTFDTYIRREITRTQNEQVMLITKGVEYRPDLVSYDIYGFPEAWWRILEANKMKDVWEFVAGKTIFLPEEVL